MEYKLLIKKIILDIFSNSIVILEKVIIVKWLTNYFNKGFDEHKFQNQSHFITVTLYEHNEIIKKFCKHSKLINKLKLKLIKLIQKLRVNINQIFNVKVENQNEENEFQKKKLIRNYKNMG